MPDTGEGDGKQNLSRRRLSISSRRALEPNFHVGNIEPDQRLNGHFTREWRSPCASDRTSGREQHVFRHSSPTVPAEVMEKQ